jgi:hypothetical protein
VPILAALAAAFVVAFLVTAGQAAGHALWLPVVLGVLGFGCLALWLWHRRALAELRHLHLEHHSDGRWTMVTKFQPYPKRCDDCAFRAHTWREASTHDNPRTSPCMAMRNYRIAVETGELVTDAMAGAGAGWLVEAFAADTAEQEPEPVEPGQREAIEQ